MLFNFLLFYLNNLNILSTKPTFFMPFIAPWTLLAQAAAPLTHPSHAPDTSYKQYVFEKEIY
jgi:hypothetical protein